MSGSVRFHSTKVAATKSLGEVAEMLRKYGAQRFEQEWEAGRTVGVRFNLPTPEAEFGFINVVLRPKVDALRAKLRRAHRIDDDEQVERVAWRQLKGILEGILMAVDTGMFTPGQVFLGMSETPSGEPLWDVLARLPSLDRLALTAGEPEVIEAEVLEETL